METHAKLAECAELIVVCCHATYTGDGKQQNESDWILQEFQRSDAATFKPSEHGSFLQHIHCGALLAAQRFPRALLLFSGGRTAAATERTEADSYACIMKHLVAANPALYPPGLPFATEDYATDSFQNLLFSILRFRHLTGAYPATITVITHAFKEARFLSLHAPAIRWPARRLRALGVNPPFTADEAARTREAELRSAYSLFAQDPYGMHGLLARKRAARNWNPASVAAVLGQQWPQAEVAELLTWTGGPSGSEMFPKRLPWEDE